MTLEDATRVLQEADVIDRHTLSRPRDEPDADAWLLWAPGRFQDHAILGGYSYTADELEAIAVWMRAYAER